MTDKAFRGRVGPDGADLLRSIDPDLGRVNDFDHLLPIFWRRSTGWTTEPSPHVPRANSKAYGWRAGPELPVLLGEPAGVYVVFAHLIRELQGRPTEALAAAASRLLLEGLVRVNGEA